MLDMRADICYNSPMPRAARIVVPGVPHHITQRGNNRQDTFFVDDDRRVYLALLKQQSYKFGLDVMAYCLMTNHIHLVATPQTTDALAKAIGRTHLIYTQYINQMHGRSGHLWQNRFHSCPLGRSRLVNTLCYVERNPVRAKLVGHAWQYEWSSAAAHTGGKDPSGLLNLRAWRRRHRDADWRETLRRPDDSDVLAALRSASSRGRPLGSDTFLSKIEKAVGRRLRPLSAGRPRKRKTKKK